MLSVRKIVEQRGLKDAATNYYILFVLAGTTLGISLLPYAWQALQQDKNMMLNNNVTNGLIGAIVFFILSLLLADSIATGIKKIEKKLSEFSLMYLLFGTLGTIIGLVLGAILSIPLITGIFRS